MAWLSMDAWLQAVKPPLRDGLGTGEKTYVTAAFDYNTEESFGATITGPSTITPYQGTNRLFSAISSPAK